MLLWEYMTRQRKSDPVPSNQEAVIIPAFAETIPLKELCNWDDQVSRSIWWFEEDFKLHFGTLPPNDSITAINQLRKRIRLATSKSNSAGLRLYELPFADPSTTRIHWNLPSGKMLVSQLTTRRLVQTFGLQLRKLVIQVANIQL